MTWPPPSKCQFDWLYRLWAAKPLSLNYDFSGCYGDR